MLNDYLQLKPYLPFYNLLYMYALVVNLHTSPMFHRTHHAHNISTLPRKINILTLCRFCQPQSLSIPLHAHASCTEVHCTIQTSIPKTNSFPKTDTIHDRFTFETLKCMTLVHNVDFRFDVGFSSLKTFTSSTTHFQGLLHLKYYVTPDTPFASFDTKGPSL